MKLYGGYVKCQRPGYTPAMAAVVVIANSMAEAIGKAILIGQDIMPLSMGYGDHSASVKEAKTEMINRIVAERA